MNFADDLYVALERNGIVTFKGEDTRYRGSNPRKVIEESMFAIVLLSRKFGYRSWLDELHEIVSCKRETGLRILPIFYYVNPSVIQREIMLFRKLSVCHKLLEHQDQKVLVESVKALTHDNEGVETWKAALTDNNEGVETSKALVEFVEQVETWNAALTDVTNLRAWNSTYQ